MEVIGFDDRGYNPLSKVDGDVAFFQVKSLRQLTDDIRRKSHVAPRAVFCCTRSDRCPRVHSGVRQRILGAVVTTR